MKAIITVLGKDQVGIIAGVSSLLAKWNVNVLDISQTILQENFTMVMLVDLENCSLSFTELTEKLSALGAEMDIAITCSGRTSSTRCTRSERGGK